MGGCASKDKKEKIVENEAAENEAGGEGCVSNSMVFLSR